MKKLLSEAAIRAKRIFLAIASFFSTLWAKVLSTFRKSKNAEAKTTYSLNNKSSAGGAVLRWAANLQKLSRAISRLCTRVTTRRRSPNPLRTPNRDPPMTPVQRRSSPAIPTLPKPRHLRQRITSISLPCRSFQCVPLTKQRMLRKQENTTM